MSGLLELLGKGLSGDLGDTLGRYYRTAGLAGITEIKRQAVEHPEYPDLQCQLGLAYLHAARPDDAVRHLALACEGKSGYLPAHVALASALADVGRPEEAIEQLKVADEANPGEAPVLFCMGYLLEKLHRPSDAARLYRQVLDIDGDFTTARFRLAAIALFTDDLAEAIEQYEQLVHEDPGDIGLRITLGQLHYRDGCYARAIDVFQSAIAMEPENWALADDYVEALVADGRTQEAIERLEEMLCSQGDFPDLHVRLGDLHSKLNDDDGALSHYRQALDAQPGYLEAQVKLGTHHLISGRWAEASEAFAQAVDLNDGLLTAYVGLGVAQQAAGETAEALATFDLASAVEPNSALLVREMARLQLKSALTTQAERHAEQPPAPGDEDNDPASLKSDDLIKLQVERHADLLAAEPYHADVRYRFGVLLRAEGRLVEALEQFEKAAEINPSYTKALIKQGVTLQDLGRTDQAIAAYRRALELEPRYVDLHYRLGLLYTEGKRFGEAVGHLEQAESIAGGNGDVRAALAVALQNMDLMDRAAAEWRSLARLQKAATVTVRADGEGEGEAEPVI